MVGVTRQYNLVKESFMVTILLFEILLPANSIRVLCNADLCVFSFSFFGNESTKEALFSIRFFDIFSLMVDCQMLHCLLLSIFLFGPQADSFQEET